MQAECTPPFPPTGPARFWTLSCCAPRASGSRGSVPHAPSGRELQMTVGDGAGVRIDSSSSRSSSCSNREGLRDAISEVDTRRTILLTLRTLAALCVAALTPLAGYAEQPPPPCHPNPQARRTWPPSPAAETSRCSPPRLTRPAVQLVRSAAYLSAHAGQRRSAGPSQFFQYYLLDTQGFERNVFTARNTGRERPGDADGYRCQLWSPHRRWLSESSSSPRPACRLIPMTSEPSSTSSPTSRDSSSFNNESGLVRRLDDPRSGGAVCGGSPRRRRSRAVRNDHGGRRGRPRRDGEPPQRA